MQESICRWGFEFIYFVQWEWLMPFCPDDFSGQYKRRWNILLSSLLHWLFLTIPIAVTDHHNRRWAHSNFGSVFLKESILSSFIPLRPTGPRNFKVICLILALSFATVFFHVRTNSTRAIFLAVIKLLDTHQYSRPHSWISFLLNVTGQTTICPCCSISFVSFQKYLISSWIIP